MGACAPDAWRHSGDEDPFGGKAPGVLGLVPGHEPSRRSDDPPPSQVGPLPREERADGPGGPRVTGLAGHFAVGHDFTGSQTFDHSANGGRKGGLAGDGGGG